MVAAGLFGPVHGKFRVVEQAGRVLLLVHPGNEADGGGEDDLAAAEIDRHHDRLADRIGKVRHLGGVSLETRMRPNWSPESRASVSCGFRRRRRRRVSAMRILSPAATPSASLTCL